MIVNGIGVGIGIAIDGIRKGLCEGWNFGE